MKQVFSILLTNNALKYRDPDYPTISCFIGDHKVEHTLLDLRANVNLLLCSDIGNLILVKLKLTFTILLLVDRSIKVLKGIIKVVLV